MSKQKGFALVELLVAMFILVSIGAVSAWFARNVIVYNASSHDSLVAQLEGRRVIKTMVPELRTTFPSAFGSYPIESVSGDSIVFYADISGGSDTERVRYFLDTPTRTLRKGVTALSGNPPVYDTQNETLFTLITEVANDPSTPVFEYFDADYAGTTTPLALPAD